MYIIKRSNRLFLVLLLITMSVFVAKAQSIQEVVYLKNGSIIRGSIVEQRPNESLTIKTPDGSVFICKIDEVEKITKEMPTDSVQETPMNDIVDAPQESNIVQQSESEKEDYSNYGWSKSSRYRGFFGLSCVVDDEYDDNTSVSFYMSHGYQIIPYVYAGIGIGGIHWTCNDEWSVPLFVNARGELHRLFKKNFSPFIDMKIGYSFGDVDGFYFSPTVGCHFYFGHSTKGISLGLGYIGIGKKEHCKGNSYWGDYYYEKYDWVGGFKIGVAFDF